ncbi:MAG: cyanophycinase [Flavobacteriales bacterium]|jgi:cyanophycinase-like exopeptidase|nr:cyanophycinase [Flavobacteriales bacterium]
MKKLPLLFFFLYSFTSYSQSYTSYFTGNIDDTITSPLGGICLMGGATEDDNAMKWFLEQANGGDILILRTSGSDGYNQYLYNQLGINVNSVESIVFNNPSASNLNYIHSKILQAEAIWFAGGNQWNYISYWRDTPIDSLIRHGVNTRNIVIGGTSAGMAIFGEYYFSAENGTVTSSTALNNPYHSKVKIDSAKFLDIDILQDIVTDTHYDDPDRKGRHIVFMSRMLTDYNSDAKGIACDEYTAVCIDTNGIARVYGGYPTYDDNAYFLRINCEISSNIPENITSSIPLTWDHSGQAIKVYKIKGISTGLNSFDLNTWEDGTGGVWENWSVLNGLLFESISNPINCNSTGIYLEDQTGSNKLTKVIDVLGKDAERENNQTLFYIYDDGTVEKKIIIE